MSDTPGPVVALLIIVGCGTIGALVASLFVKREKRAAGRRAAEPYVGFLLGAVVGTAAVLGWRIYF